MRTLDHGSYTQIDGRTAVRFERVYDHPVERVWQAVTDPDRMSAWFPSPEIAYEARVGGTITLAGDPYAEEAGAGRVTAWDPPRRFAFEWGEDELAITLSPHGTGCRLVFVDFLASPGGAARQAAGWEVCLDELRKALGGAPGSGPHSSATLEFRPLLEHYRRAGLPDDGWLPDGV